MMKSCPFCGAGGEHIQQALLRVVCLGCGASGPLSPDPWVAWEDRQPSVVKKRHIASEWDSLRKYVETGIELDGSPESVSSALDEIFRPSRKMR